MQKYIRTNWWTFLEIDCPSDLEEDLPGLNELEEYSGFQTGFWAVKSEM
jgi:hypothetical protein